MRGIVYTGEGVEVTDALEVRGPGPNEVQVRMQAAGVCHSDLSVIDGTIPFPAPAVLGHEGAGIVEAVGDAVRSVKPGDHVVIATLASCGACRACSTGHPTWCKSSLGNISTPFTFKGEPASNFAAASVFSELTVVSEVQAVRIPKDIPLSSACLIGCGVLTGVGAVLNRAKVKPGDTAAVFGVGGVGLNVIQGLRIAGATRIVAVDTVAAKEELGPAVRRHALRRRRRRRRRGGRAPARPGRPGVGRRRPLPARRRDLGLRLRRPPRRPAQRPGLPRLGRQRGRHRHPAPGHRGGGGRQRAGLRRPRPARVPLRLGPARTTTSPSWSTSTSPGCSCSTSWCR